MTEVLVVNNNSVDQTSAVIKSYRQKLHIREINELQRDFALDPDEVATMGPAHEAFPLERGQEILSQRFGDVAVYAESGTVLVDDPDLLVDYVSSMSVEVDVDSLRSHVSSIIDSSGHFPVTRSTGVLVATR